MGTHIESSRYQGINHLTEDTNHSLDPNTIHDFPTNRSSTPSRSQELYSFRHLIRPPPGFEHCQPSQTIAQPPMSSPPPNTRREPRGHMGPSEAPPSTYRCGVRSITLVTEPGNHHGTNRFSTTFSAAIGSETASQQDDKQSFEEDRRASHAIRDAYLEITDTAPSPRFEAEICSNQGGRYRETPFEEAAYLARLCGGDTAHANPPGANFQPNHFSRNPATMPQLTSNPIILEAQRVREFVRRRTLLHHAIERNRRTREFRAANIVLPTRFSDASVTHPFHSGQTVQPWIGSFEAMPPYAHMSLLSTRGSCPAPEYVERRSRVMTTEEDVNFIRLDSPKRSEFKRRRAVAHQESELVVGQDELSIEEAARLSRLGPGAYSTTSKYVSPQQTHKNELERLRKQLRFINAVHSPFIPKTVVEAADQKLWNTNRILDRLLEKKLDKEEMRARQHETCLVIDKAFGGRKLPSQSRQNDYLSQHFGYTDASPALSSVLAENSVWASCPLRFPQAEWPCLAELKAYGDERASGFSLCREVPVIDACDRMLPPPKCNILSENYWMPVLMRRQGPINMDNLIGGIPWNRRQTIGFSWLDEVGLDSYARNAENEAESEEEEKENDIDSEKLCTLQGTRLINEDLWTAIKKEVGEDIDEAGAYAESIARASRDRFWNY